MISPPYLLIPFHLLFQPLFHSVDQSFLAHCFHILHGLKKDKQSAAKKPTFKLLQVTIMKTAIFFINSVKALHSFP